MPFVYLLDSSCKIIWINRTLPPGDEDRVVGQTPWAFSADEEGAERVYQAAARCLIKREQTSTTMNCEVPSGLRNFSVDFYPLSIGEARAQVVARMVSSPDQKIPPQQIQVARYLLMGMSLKQVAKEMDRAPSTIATHRQRLYRTLKIGSVAELARVGALYGWM